MKTTREFRDETSPDTRDWRGMIRRVAISLTSGASWQAIGHILLDGRTRETRDAEVFPGIGFYARPAAGVNAEAIVAFVGGASNPHIVATRDEDTRKKVAQLDQDETAMFNSTTIAAARKDGTFEVRSAPTGASQPMLLGTTYRAAEDTMLNALVAATDALITYASAISAVADPTHAATPALLLALGAFHSAATNFQSSGSTYLTTVLKAQ